MQSGSHELTRYYCERCGLYRDGASVRSVQRGHVSIPACGACGDALRLEQQRVSEPFPMVLARAFLFPFSPVMLVTIAVTGAAVVFVRFVPLVGGALSSTMVLSLIFAVVRATGAGRDDLGLEGISEHFWDWFQPLVRYVLTLLVAFGPAALLTLLLGYHAGAALVLPALALGALYFPAGIIVAAHNEGCIAPFNPFIGLRLIARIPGPYFVTLAFLLVAAVSTWLMLAALVALDRMLSAIPFLPVLVSTVLILIGPVVMARLLGLLMREYKDDL